MKPLISVIIPVYNHAHTISRTLFSIYTQSYRPLEVIVVNDGSTDDFKEAMEKVTVQPWAADLPIGILEQPNKGANAARNAGYRLAKGEYVIFWDADTIADPEMLQKMYDVLVENKNASYAYSRFKFGWKVMKSQQFNDEDLKEYNYIDITSLIKKQALSSGSPFDETLKKFMDWDLWLSLLKEDKRGVFIPEVLYKKEVKGRKGYSLWLPAFVYNLPFKSKKVREYEVGRAVIQKKHGLQPLTK